MHVWSIYISIQYIVSTANVDVFCWTIETEPYYMCGSSTKQDMVNFFWSWEICGVSMCETYNDYHFRIQANQWKRILFSKPCLLYFHTSSIILPIESMYGIFTYIYHKTPPNVSKYTIHGWYEFWMDLWCLERRCFSHHDGHQPSHLNCPPPEITQAGRWFKDDDGSSLLIFLKNIWEKPLAKTCLSIGSFGMGICILVKLARGPSSSRVIHTLVLARISRVSWLKPTAGALRFLCRTCLPKQLRAASYLEITSSELGWRPNFGPLAKE